MVKADIIILGLQPNDRAILSPSPLNQRLTCRKSPLSDGASLRRSLSKSPRTSVPLSIPRSRATGEAPGGGAFLEPSGKIVFFLLSSRMVSTPRVGLINGLVIETMLICRIPPRLPFPKVPTCRDLEKRGIRVLCGCGPYLGGSVAPLDHPHPGSPSRGRGMFSEGLVQVGQARCAALQGHFVGRVTEPA